MIIQSTKMIPPYFWEKHEFKTMLNVFNLYF